MLRRVRIKTRKIKNVRVPCPHEINPIDLASTPPRPSPTRITEEAIPNSSDVTSLNPYKDIILGTLKEKIDKYVEL